jgi:hypothetical protein
MNEESPGSVYDKWNISVVIEHVHLLSLFLKGKTTISRNLILEVINKPCQYRSSDCWADDTVSD